MMQERGEGAAGYKSLGTSKAAKKKLMDLFQDEYNAEEAKLPPPYPNHPIHIKIYRGIRRRILGLPPDIPPTRKQMRIPLFMNAASRDRYGFCLVSSLLRQLDIHIAVSSLH